MRRAPRWTTRGSRRSAQRNLRRSTSRSASLPCRSRSSSNRRKNCWRSCARRSTASVLRVGAARVNLPAAGVGATARQRVVHEPPGGKGRTGCRWLESPPTPKCSSIKSRRFTSRTARQDQWRIDPDYSRVESSTTENTEGTEKNRSIRMKIIGQRHVVAGPVSDKPSLSAVVVGLGFSAFVTQVVMMRELVSVLGGQ